MKEKSFYYQTLYSVVECHVFHAEKQFFSNQKDLLKFLKSHPYTDYVVRISPPIVKK